MTPSPPSKSRNSSLGAGRNKSFGSGSDAVTLDAQKDVVIKAAYRMLDEFRTALGSTPVNLRRLWGVMDDFVEEYGALKLREADGETEWQQAKRLYWRFRDQLTIGDEGWLQTLEGNLDPLFGWQEHDDEDE